MNEKATVSDMIEKVFLMGIGAASLTRDKLQELVDELVKRGQLTREQGEDLVDKAQHKARERGIDVKETMSQTYQDTLLGMGIATRETVDELERRVSVLEAKVYGKQARVEEPDLGFRVTTTEEEEPT
ncbi:MAG: phasin family protein [Thermoleophilia bacterium]|nr:phasin family protein [Thermoleophilia bacterium]